MRFTPIAHPIFSPAEAKAFEDARFHGDEAAEWVAMRLAGGSVAQEVLEDFRTLHAWPTNPRLLVLVGKGHNGGDALIAAQGLLERLPGATAEVVFPFPESTGRPLTLRAYQDLIHMAGERCRSLSAREFVGRVEPSSYDLSLDGVFGFQFHPPLDARMCDFFAKVEQTTIAMRAAVDLPSGLGDIKALRADFTYATGSLKQLVLEKTHREKVGRVRYLDLGFFEGEPSSIDGVRLLSRRSLCSLRQWRDPYSDKRTYGHLFVIGGSRSYPGAVMMATRAALKSGVGLLTAFVPESLVAAYAAHVPEAMWVGCPETPEGGISLEASHLVKERAERANALVIGPGLGREPETLAFVKEILKTVELPTVLDADALQPELVVKGARPRVITPHAGEFKRLAGERSAEDYARETGIVTVLKGVQTRITNGRLTYLSIAGSPVLARGGSGDMLAGMTGGLIAQESENVFGAAALAVLWHGTAAEHWARACGETAVNTTQLLDFLPAAIRGPHAL